MCGAKVIETEEENEQGLFMARGDERLNAEAAQCAIDSKAVT